VVTLTMGWIPYLNLLPLKVELSKLTDVQFIAKEGHPREVNKWLADGEVGLAPSSSVNLLDNPHLKMAFPLGVTS
jgi:predicted solute-binding protein